MQVKLLEFYVKSLGQEQTRQKESVYLHPPGSAI